MYYNLHINENLLNFYKNIDDSLAAEVLNNFILFLLKVLLSNTLKY